MSRPKEFEGCIVCSLSAYSLALDNSVRCQWRYLVFLSGRRGALRYPDLHRTHRAVFLQWA